MNSYRNKAFFNALLENDVKVLEEVYREVFPVLKKYIGNNKGTEDDAWDIFQESLIVLLNIARTGGELKADFRFYWSQTLVKTMHFSARL